MARSAEVVSHWHLLVDDFATSSQEFYASVRANIESRKVPGATAEQIEWKEGGLFTAGRIYLRFRRDRLLFDLCAAPFGTSFFFSWWLAEEHPDASLMALTIYGGMPIAFLALVVKAGILLGPFIFLILCIIALLIIREGSNSGNHRLEDLVLAVPLVGRIYGAIFKPFTYYRADARLSYQESIHRAVVEAIDSVRSLHGLRALSSDEIRPTMRDLVR